MTLTTITYTLRPGGLAPFKATEGAAGYDLFACLPEDVSEVVLVSGKKVKTFKVKLGVCFQIPPGWVGKLFMRSSLGALGVSLANAVGIIDSDYRGEVAALLTVAGYDFAVTHGMRLAQIIFERLPPVELVEVDALDETARGEGGFGSTNKEGT